ncbi:hypothetical protein [Ramlibacter sp.]|uniref:hypothetical protein n=1 Tax=Ramlibacter sp. TaxID=1917967 RepID=UPI002BD337CC|nr:hypothetical protein [Ramlibacter sp.]HWI80765.1 hypothetical protein [Ramlibacter sp.]
MAAADWFDRWRAADRVAALAARAMADKSMQALEGRGEPPSLAEAAQLKRLHRHANRLLQAALARLQRAVHANSHRPGAGRPGGDWPF